MARPKDQPPGKPPGGSTPVSGRFYVDSQFPTPPRGSGALNAPASSDSGGTRLDPGDLVSGTVLGKYQIVQRLGVGGMGSVYEAIHTGINKAVALKTMSASLAADPRAAARFMREAAAASRLDHPHVVGVTDFGTDHGVSYLVMELLRGEDLATLIANDPGGLDPVVLADIMLAVCAGVYAAHESGVIHRDLKPQNIFLSRTSLGETVPKVLDFGISKMADEDVNASLTNTGMVMGTTHYLSPEQVQNKPIDARSDQYSLGVILYESLTGRRPHVGTSVYEVMRSISEGSFVPPRKLRPDVPPAMEAVVMRAMATRAQDRFESVHGLGRALMKLASQKRRVIWADYYEGRGGSVAAAMSLPNPVRPQTPQHGTGMSAPAERGTRMMNVAPARLSPTRTHFLPEEVRAAVLAEATASDDSEDARPEVERRARRRPPPSRIGPRLAIFAALALAGVGAFFIWRSPRLRAQLPDAMRATLERPSAPDQPATPTDDVTSKGAPTTPAVPPPAAGANPGERVSPFAAQERTVWPFQPTPGGLDARASAEPTAPPPADTPSTANPVAAVPPDAGAMPSLLRRVVTASGVSPPEPKPEPISPPSGAIRIYSGPTTPAAVQKKKKKPTAEMTNPYVVPATPADAPATTRPPAPLPPHQVLPPGPPPPQPPPDDLPPPEQVPAKRYFGPGKAPILE